MEEPSYFEKMDAREKVGRFNKYLLKREPLFSGVCLLARLQLMNETIFNQLINDKKGD